MARITDDSVQESVTSGASLPVIDRYRSFIFPNNIRKYRKARGIDSLLQLSQHIDSTTYIRLSKIERGEIFARPEEMRNIAAALNVDVDLLFLDIDDPDFDIASWAADHMPPSGVDEAGDTLAVLLAAAMRARRAQDDALTIAVLERDYGLAPVILSRIENAFKTLDRWSPSIQEALFRLFQVRDAEALTHYLHAAHVDGDYDAVLPLIANPQDRITKTRAKIRSLRAELAAPASSPRRRRESPPVGRLAATIAPLPSDAALIPAPSPVMRRLVPIYGALLPDGLIEWRDTGDQIEVPQHAGPRSYGLRIFRSSLGPGLPGRSVLIVDPDCFPASGSLAVIREAEGLRLLAVTTDRQGHVIGFSEHPSREIALDDLDPKLVATVIAAQFE
jgi:hypothetical protein